ncbi:hypothetical protein BV372_20465 [Nostoc sp. T09]|nr:hypothetical protein BV372_20465 [Nostoc sp. T09]
MVLISAIANLTGISMPMLFLRLSKKLLMIFKALHSLRSNCIYPSVGEAFVLSVALITQSNAQVIAKIYGKFIDLM